MQSIKLRSKQKQNNQFIIIELQRTSRGYQVLPNDSPQSTKIKINKNSDTSLIQQNGHSQSKQTLPVQSKPFQNGHNVSQNKQSVNNVAKQSSNNYNQSNGDYQNPKNITDTRNQSFVENPHKLKLEVANKMDKVRNEAMIKYEDNFRKVMESDEDYQMQQYQVQSWFDISSISIIEKQAIPEFFDGSRKSKTAEIYQKYRNYMIVLYQRSPRKYINFTTIRRNLAGDVNGLIKIYKQLQKWGLINYNCNPVYNYQDQESRDSRVEIYNRIESRLDANLLKKKGDYKYEIDMLNQNIKYLNYKYRVHCQFCEQFCNSFCYQNKQNVGELNQLCVECYSYLSRNQRVSSQDYNKLDIIQKQISQNDESQQNKYFNANDSQKMIELMAQSLNDNELMEQVNPSKKKDEYLIHLLQLPFKNESYQKLVDDQLDQNEQMKWLETNSKMYFQNLRDQEIKLMDYVYEMIHQINLFNKALQDRTEDESGQNENGQKQSIEDNDRLEQLLNQCLKIGEMFQKDQVKCSQEDVQSKQLTKFINYMWSIRFYLLNMDRNIQQDQKREFIVRFLQYSQIYLVKLKQQDYEKTEKVIRRELNNLEIYRKQQIKSKVDSQLEQNQRRTDIETGNKIYIKLANNETLLADHSYIY